MTDMCYDGSMATFPRFDPHAPRIQRIECARKCGWFREYTASPEWSAKVVDHPLYGPIPELELVQLDVRTHECVEYHNSLVRLRRARHSHAA